MLSFLNNVLRGVLPYCVMAVLGVWSLSLQDKLAALQYENETLTTQFAQYVSNAKNTERMLERWADSQRSILEWREGLHEALSEQDDPVWGNTQLPHEYIRVLHEAGIYNGSIDAPRSADAGGGDSEAEGDNESGSPEFCSRGGSRCR